MDAKTRYSVGCIVPSTCMKEAISAFECTWMSELWPHASVQGDQRFSCAEFTDYRRLNDIYFRPVTPRSHSKHFLELKHRILRDIYLRLKSVDEACYPRSLVSKMFRISNDL